MSKPSTRSRKARFQLSFDPKVVELARTLAKQERRSLSNMLEVLVVRAHSSPIPQTATSSTHSGAVAA